MKTVGKYATSFEANLIKGFLENEGIQATVLNENINYVLPATNVATSIEVAVSDEDYDRAKKIIAERD